MWDYDKLFQNRLTLIIKYVTIKPWRNLRFNF